MPSRFERMCVGSFCLQRRQSAVSIVFAPVQSGHCCRLASRSRLSAEKKLKRSPPTPLLSEQYTELAPKTFGLGHHWNAEGRPGT
jgi:hypothetical protein